MFVLVIDSKFASLWLIVHESLKEAFAIITMSDFQERDALSVRTGELEDYLDLERQKFKQASDEIAQFHLQSQQSEDAFRDQVYSLQEEISRVR